MDFSQLIIQCLNTLYSKIPLYKSAFPDVLYTFTRNSYLSQSLPGNIIIKFILVYDII